MSSTNDGKEVKSYQTSGPKGKTYFIELYKSLEARLNEATGSERTKHLCEAWRRVHSLCQHSALTAHSHLLSWLQRHTARTVLPVEWQLPDRKDDRASLEEAINVFIVESRTAAACRDGTTLPWEEQLVARGEWFKRILDHPWKHPVLSCLLNPDGTPPTDDEVLKWLKEERGVTFVMRLHTLVAEKCDDIAMSLANAVMERVRRDIVIVSDAEQSEEPKEKLENTHSTFGDKLREEAGFTVDIWEMLTDIEFVLLHKRDSIRCIALAKQTPLRSAYQLIERLQSRLETSPREKRLWKNSKEVAVLIAQVVIARCMVVPVCGGAARSALYCCARSLARLTARARLPAAAAALAAPAPTAAHLHTLAAAVDAQLAQINDPSMKPFVCELYVRAITAGMNELERLKLKTEKDTEARCMESTLASWFMQLGGVLASSDRVKCECALTAFSVHPSPLMYERIKAAPPLPPIQLDVEQKPTEATNPEFGSWASDSRGQSNFVKTSETLNMKARQNQANVLSTAILSEGEALGLSPELCQDITVLLSGPRVKTLSWDMDRELLLENCLAYLERTHGGTKAVTTELKYLNLNPDDFQYLPEEDEDESNIYYGIEKGYEHLVEFQEPEDIWEDAYEDIQNAGSSGHSSDEFDFVQPQRRRRTKKTLNPDEDDPLSFVAETKRKEKKERPHSKERSKERKKTDSEKKPTMDPLEISDGNQEKKEKPKRVRKKKVKPEGSLSNLVGLKVGKKKTVKHTDSDVDSQKSVRSVNSDVVYDGTFSMDEMRSPSSLNADIGTFNSCGRMGTDSFTNMTFNRPYRPQSVSGVRIASPSPSRSYSASEHSRNNSPTHISDEVKSSISKLLEYRRQKAIEERKKPNTIIHPDGSLPMEKINISPKAVAIPEIPKSYISKQSDNISSLLKQNVDGILSHRKPNAAIPSPVIQYASKVSPDKHSRPHYGPSQYQDRMIPPDRCFSTPPSSDRFLDNVNLISIYDKGEQSPSRTAYKPSYSNASRTEDHRTNDMSHLNYQDYRHEFSLHSYKQHMENSDAPKKVIKPISRVTPVIPHMKSETKSPQSAKQIQQRKPDASLNTFSRLSYYKNKQTDIRKSQELPQSQTTVSSKLDGFIMNHLRQSESTKPHVNQINDYQSLTKKYEKPKTRDHPLLTNILQSNTSRSTQEKPAGLVKTVTSEKDQNDLLLLWRQQQALNIHNKPVMTCARYPLNSPIASSSKAVTSSTDAIYDVKSIAASTLMPNPQIGNSNETTKIVNEAKVINVLSTSIIKAADQETIESKPEPPSKKPTQGKPKKTESRDSKSIKRGVRKNLEEWENVMDAILKQKTPCRGPNALEMALNNTSFEKAFMNSLQNPTNLFAAPNKIPSVISKTDYDHESLKKISKASTSSSSLKPDKKEKITQHSLNDLQHQSLSKKSSRSRKSMPTVAELLKQRQHEDKTIEKLMQLNQIQITKRDLNVQKSTDTTSQHNIVNPKPLQQHIVEMPKTAAQQHDVQMANVQQSNNEYLKNTANENNLTNTHTKQIAGEKPKNDANSISGVQVKQHDVGPKRDDPCIPRIPNSDYDLLDALMDDDLRKEIGELSSDEECYTTAAQEFLKNTKTDGKNVRVVCNQSCESAPKPQVSAISECIKVCKEQDSPPSFVQIPVQQPLINKEALKMTLKPTENKPTMTLNTTNVQKVTHVVCTKPIQNHAFSKVDLHSSQITVEPNVYITAAPRTSAPNVMIIPPGLMYDGYSSVQSTVQAVSNLAPNAYIAVSNAPSISLYQATQYAAPVVSPLIIASAVASPVVNIVPFATTVQPRPDTNEQTPSSYLSYELHQSSRLSSVQGGITDIDKVDVKATSSIPNHVTEVEILQKFETKVPVDDNVGTSGERKVLKEVQEKHTDEKIESKRRTQKVSDKDIKMKTDQERVKRKRMAILNRKINIFCGIETIALGYSSLQLSTQKEDKNNEVADNRRDDVILSNQNNLQDQLQEDIKSPATPDSYKENKSEPARRILLRSSNKLKAKLNSPSTSSKPSVDKKHKGLVHSVDTQNEMPSENYQSATETISKSKRVSKRTLNKSVTSSKDTEINKTNLPRKTKTPKAPKMTEINMSHTIATSNKDIETEQFFDIEAELLGSTIPKITPINSIDSPLISNSAENTLDKKETKASSIHVEHQQNKDQPLNETMKSPEINESFNASDETDISDFTKNKTENTNKINKDLLESKCLSNNVSTVNSLNEVETEKFINEKDIVVKDISVKEANSKGNQSIVKLVKSDHILANNLNPPNDEQLIDLDLEVVSEEVESTPTQLGVNKSTENVTQNGKGFTSIANATESDLDLEVVSEEVESTPTQLGVNKSTDSVTQNGKGFTSIGNETESDLDLEVVSEEVESTPSQLGVNQSTDNVTKHGKAITSIVNEIESKEEHSAKIGLKHDTISNDVVQSQIDVKDISTIEIDDDDDDIKVVECVPNATLSKSFLDSVKIETLSTEKKDPRVKTVRITLPNGKAFKGVISGTCNVEKVLDNLNIKSYLVSQFQEKKKKYSMRLDVNRDIISILPKKVNKVPQGPIETVSLLSDDEEDEETPQVFETEYGKHKIRTINNDLFKKHQLKLKQKTSVPMEKLKKEENITECRPKTSNKTNITSITHILKETIVLSDVDAELKVHSSHNVVCSKKNNINTINLSAIPSKYVKGVLSDVENILTPVNKQTIEEPIVLIDDSSNECVDIQDKPEPQEKLNKLKQMLLKDLLVDNLLSARLRSAEDTWKNPEEVDLTGDSLIELTDQPKTNEKQDYRKIINRKCFIKLVRCDDVVNKKKYQPIIEKYVETVNDDKADLNDTTDVNNDKVDVNDRKSKDEKTDENVVDANKTDVNNDKAGVDDDGVKGVNLEENYDVIPAPISHFVNDNEADENDEESKEMDDITPARVSRSGSFSILEDFPTLDEENQKVTTQPNRSSPVMEIYDLLASLKDKCSTNENIQVIHVLCDTEWTTTKKYEHIIQCLKNKHPQVSSKLHEVPKLATLLLSLIQKEDLATRYTSVEQQQRYPTSLKRKSDSSLRPLAKISKLVNASDKTKSHDCSRLPTDFSVDASSNENNDDIMSAAATSEELKTEDKRMIDSIDFSQDLSDTDVTSMRGNTPIVELFDIGVAVIGHGNDDILSADKEAEMQEKSLIKTHLSDIIMVRDTNVPSKEIFKEIFEKSSIQLADDIPINCSSLGFGIVQMNETNSDTISNIGQSLTTRDEALDQVKDDGYSTITTVTDMVHDDDSIPIFIGKNNEDQEMYNVKSICTTSKDYFEEIKLNKTSSDTKIVSQEEVQDSVESIISSTSNADKVIGVNKTCDVENVTKKEELVDEMVESRDSSLSNSNSTQSCSETCIKIENQSSVAMISSTCDKTGLEEILEIQKTNDPRDTNWSNKTTAMQNSATSVESQMHVNCDVQESKNMLLTKDIDTDSVELPYEVSIITKIINENNATIEMENINAKEETLSRSNVTHIPKTNDEIIDTLYKIFGESEVVVVKHDVRNIELDQNEILSSSNDVNSSGCEKNGISEKSNVTSTNLTIASNKVQIDNDISNRNSSDAAKIPKTNDEIDDALKKMFGEPEVAQVVVVREVVITDNRDLIPQCHNITTSYSENSVINEDDASRKALVEDLENDSVVKDIVEMLNENVDDITITTMKSNTLDVKEIERTNVTEKCVMADCDAIDTDIDASSDVLSILNQYSESNGKIEIKGVEYEDPIVGTRYVFSVIKEVSDINEQDCLLSEHEESIDNNEHQDEVEDFVLMIPKRTYAKNPLIRRSFRSMKRKKDMSEIKTSEKKYRKGKNIDYPKITASAIAELAYAKEYKRIMDYCSTIKFSYIMPFHIDNIDVGRMLKSWPVNQSPVLKETSCYNDEGILYKDTEESESIIADPLHQTLSDEILNAEYIRNYKPTDINETNFNKGFGERSGRVIQKIETGFTKLSAATLSDVKQYQPFSMSDVRKAYPCIAHDMDSIKVKLSRFSNLISMKEKVRSFFKKTAVELNKELLQDKKNTARERQLSKFPFGLTSPEFIEIPIGQSVVNVVQVGQLPVTAQNPVTCDPRVTHVSNASPSQCSDNSPGVDTQASVETEYTELTTANITLPLVQEYAQNLRQSPSQEQNSPENDDDMNGPSQTLSIVKIELMEEETSQEKVEDEMYDHGFSPLPNNNVEYSFEDTPNNLFHTSGNTINTAHTSKTNIFHTNSSMNSTFNNMFNNTANMNDSYSNMDPTPSSAESTYTSIDNASANMYSTSPNMGNSSNEMENTTSMSITSPNEDTTHVDNNTNMDDTYTNTYNPVGSDSNDMSNTSTGIVASNVNSPENSENRRMDINRTSNMENTAYDYSYESIEDYASNMEHNNNADDYSRGVDNYAAGVDNYSSSVDDYTSNVDNYATNGENYNTDVNNYASNVENYATNIQNYSTNVDNYTTNIENVNRNSENNHSHIDDPAASLLEEPQDLSITNSSQESKNCNKFEETNSSKVNQIKHAMNAAGISSESVITSSADELANLISQSAQVTANNYTKSTPINVMTLQQALAQVLPPPLNQNSTSENQVPSNPVSQQVLHIVQGSNAQTVINKPNGTHLLHIVQNKNNPGSSLSLVDAGLQQVGNQLIHIVNNGNQNNAQFLKRVNLLTNLTNAQGANEQKMIQFVCKSADGKSIQLNAGHQRSMVLRLHPTAVQTAPKPAEPQDVSGPTTGAANAASNQDPSQEIKSRSMYEENYAQFIQNTGPTPGPSGASTSSCLEKATSLPKFNQVFGKQSYQENEMEHSGLQENSECPPEENTSHLEQTPEVNNPPLLVRNTPPETTQAQPSPAQQIKQTISPMNIHTTMHGGVIYTRQIPVNIGGGQTINLITVPSTELVDESPQKQQTDGSFVNKENEQSSIIKLVSHHATNNSNAPQEENNTQTGRANEPNPTPQPPTQPVLTQMRIKLPMISKGPHLVPGARIVRPSFFQIQRNVIAGTNPPVYQQVVLATAPPLGQTIRLPAQAARSPQAPPILVQTSQHAQPSPHIPVQQVQHAPSSQHLSAQQNHAAPPTPQPQSVASELPKPDTEPDSELSTLTLEQLREFDMVLEQVKERSVQPTPSTTPKTKPTPADSTDGSSLASTSSKSESTQPVLYSADNSQPTNVVSYVNRKSTITSATTSFARSPDSTGVADTPSSSTKVHITHTVTSKSSTTEGGSAAVVPHPKKKKKKKPSSSSSALSSLGSPSKSNALKPQEDEQTTQRILYILAEYKEQVENSPDKNKPAPRRRNQFPPTIGSKRKRSHCSSRAMCRREGVDMSPMHGEHGELGDDSLITLGSEDSSCGTTFSECTDCQETNSPEDTTKVVRRLTFEQETTTTQITQTVPPRNVIVGDRQTITVARTTTATATAKPTTTVLMPANYLLPVSMLKGGQQIAIMTNRGPKILVGDSNAGALLLQRLIGPGIKPVLARSGVRHIRLPTTTLHNLQGFNIQTTPVTQVQPPDSTAHQVPTPTPPDLVDTRAMSSPWQDREAQDKPERGPSPDCTEPWNLPSSSIADDYGYEEIVRTDNMERTVLDAIPDRYSPDMEAQRIFDKMFDVDSKKSMYDSSRCGYDIDTSDGDDKPYPQVVQQRKDGRHHRVTHVSTAALRHKYAILEHELRLQKSLSEECEDLGVDSPSASDLFPEADILFGAPSPAHEQTIDQCTTPPPIPISQTIPQPDLDDQIATDQLLTQNANRNDDLDLNLDDVGEIVTVGEDGIATIPTINAEEFARSHPNTTFHTEPEDGEIPPYTIAQSIKGRHITFHANRVPGTVVMAPQTTVISQATVNSNDAHNTVKFIDIDNMINSMPCPQPVSVQSVLVKDSATRPVSKFDSLKDSGSSKPSSKFDSLKEPGTSHKTSSKFDSSKDPGHFAHKSSSKFDSLKDPSTHHASHSQRPIKSSSKFDSQKDAKSYSKFDSHRERNSAPKALSKFDSLLTDSKSHLSNTSTRQGPHSTGHGTQVIRRLRYDERTNSRPNNRFHFEHPKRTSISDEVKMRNDRAIVESMGDNASSPGQPELFWDSTATERQERRFNFSESEKVAKSPFDELLNDSSAYGPHTRLDSVIKAARPERTYERTSFEGISGSEETRPLRTYPPKRVHTQHTQDSERHFTLKSTTTTRHHETTKTTHHHDSDRNKKRPRCHESEGRRRTGRGLVKRGCSCCNGSGAPPKKRSRPKKPSPTDLMPTTKSDTLNLT